MGLKSSNNKAKKQKSTFQGFFKTFIIAFIVFVVVGTPSMALLGKVADGRFIPTAEGEEVRLRDELPFIVNKDSPFFEAFKDNNRANILLLGVNGGLTDTIMVASFDMESKHMDLISIPRDTYYHREGYNDQAENKLNAAYKKNPVNTAKAVSEILLGMPINYYAVIDYEGVENIVESMGGIPMTIKKGGMYYNDPYNKPKPLKIAIPEGPQVLNGKKAVEFLRYRSGYKEGDIGRVKAQQEFMKSAFKQCLSFDLPKIAKTVFQNVDSDITTGMVTKLATKAIGMSGESISTYLMPGIYQNEAPWYVYPESKGIADMINEIYSIEPETPTKSGIEQE